MQPVEDNIVLEQLKRKENGSFEILYKCHFESTAAYITNYFGSAEDAEDIFRQAVTVLRRNVRQPGFVLTTSVKSYLFAIVRHLWSLRLQNNMIRIVGKFETCKQQTEETRKSKIVLWLSKIANHWRQTVNK